MFKKVEGYNFKLKVNDNRVYYGIILSGSMCGQRVYPCKYSGTILKGFSKWVNEQGKYTVDELTRLIDNGVVRMLPVNGKSTAI